MPGTCPLTCLLYFQMWKFFCYIFIYIKVVPLNIYRHEISFLEKQIIPVILLMLCPLEFKDCVMMLIKGFTNFKARTDASKASEESGSWSKARL